MWVIDNNSIITNCSYCHIGGGREFNDVFAEVNKSNITHGVNCIACHGSGRIHNESLKLPAAGDCTACHFQGVDASSLPLINKTGFLNSSNIHRNVTGDFSDTNYTQLSRVCWGCHVNYTEQLINESHTKPVSELPKCEDCHFNATPYNSNHLNKTPPLQAIEHQPEGEDIRTNPGIANCTICHNKSLTIPPPAANINNRRAKNYVSHYGIQRKDMWVIDNNNIITNCSYCHLGGGREFNDVFADANNTNITHGVNCIACHGSGRIHDESLKLPVMGENNEDCLFCHNNMTDKFISASAFGNSAHKNLKCIDCHTPRQVKEGMIVNRESHAYNFSIPAKDKRQKIANVTLLNATLDWTGDSILNLTLKAPDNTTNNGTRINISSPKPGNWIAVVWDESGDAQFTLNINVSLKHPGSTPKECQECHIRDFGYAPLVYRHLPDQSSVPTNASCASCHALYALAAASNINITASHYLIKEPFDTQDCIRCHEKNDIGSKWGVPYERDPRNHTDHAFVNKTLISGKPWKLVDNYTLTLIETARPGGAIFVFEKDGVLLRRELVSDNDVFKYEVRGLGRENTSIVNLRINKLFAAKDQYLVELSGSVLASHIHRETDNKSCYACHDNEYRTNMPDGMDYYVLKKDAKNVTLARMPVNFTEHDRKMLNMGEYWELGEGYRLHVADVELKRGGARLKLYRNETLIEDIIINEGSNFTHEERVLERKINVFSAKLDRVFIGKTPAIVLTNVRLIAGEQKILNSSTQILQTGTSLKYLPLDKSITVGKEPKNFHVYTLTPGGYSSDCISCHAGNGVAPIKIDIDAFRKGMHAGLNRNATYNSFITDEANKACWACHGNGSSSEPVVHPTPYLGSIAPQTTCIGCHGYSQFGAKQIYQHYPGAEIATNATCWDCHLSTFANSTKNGLAATSHYSTRKELLNTSHCDVCHNNETNALRWGRAPQVIKHNASSNCTLCHAGAGITTFHDKGITITRICEDCHVNKEKADEFKLAVISTHYPGAPEDKANTLKYNSYTCRVCHNATNKTLHTYLEVREYRNETMGYCFPCHSREGKFPYKPEIQIGVLRHGTGIRVIAGCEACHAPEGVSKFHTPSLVGKGYFSGAVSYEADCTACHEKHEERKYQPYEGIRCTDCHSEYGTAHYAGAQAKMANKTWTCVLCHNEEAERFHNLTHLAANVTEAAYEPCLDCHRDAESLKVAYNRSLTIIGGTMSGISQPISNESMITCTSCHNATGESTFHYDSYPGGTVQNPGWQNWTAGNVTDCKDCHTYHGGAPPFNATNMGTEGRSPAGTAHGFAPNCTLCHGGADSISFHSLASTEFIPRIAVTLDPENVPQGESSLLQATVVLPPLMKVTRAEYFMDEIGRDGYGQPLEFVLGRVNESSALVGAVINTTELSFGKHLIFVHAKDSAGKWSKIEIAVLTVTKPAGFAAAEILLKEIVPAVIFIGLLYFIWRRFR
ncbi:MAG: S-layer protein domain-containing protein [Candidatus Methanoperedens sp.]|nr:S-layer protein domain-containing protein [Candidatus Methanoperedens sp.]